MSFYVTWLVYAGLYYLIAWQHGDFDGPGGSFIRNDTFKPCVWEMEDFASAFLFSLETQHTIGYGSRQVRSFTQFKFWYFKFREPEIEKG